MHLKPRLGLLPVLASLVALGIIGAQAEPLPCPGDWFRVDTDTPAKRAMICEAAEVAKQALSACHLTQSAPLDIKTVDTLEHAMGRCLASFDCDLGLIRIVDPDTLHDHLVADDPYATLPDAVVFRSLLTHELAHALLDQLLNGRKIPLVDHEYTANALELAAMPPRHRETLLNAAGVEPPVSDDVIDVFIYSLAPRRFAAASFLHFQAHGCAPIRGILDGSFTFRVER